MVVRCRAMPHLISILFIVLSSFAAVASFNVADNESVMERALVNLNCNDGIIRIDEGCIEEAELSFERTLAAADAIRDKDIAKAEKNASQRIRAAKRKLRKALQRNTIKAKCEDADNVNVCTNRYINRQEFKFRQRKRKIKRQEEKEIEEATEGSKASRNVARRAFRKAENDCCFCERFSIRF